MSKVFLAQRKKNFNLLSDNQPMITAPINLMEIMERQAVRLIEIGAHTELGIKKDKYFDELMTIAKTFVWRPELAAIDLTEVALIDYRLRAQFLADAGDIVYHCYYDPDKYQNFEGVITPSGIMAIQAQWGKKYKNKRLSWCRSNFHTLEKGGIVNEGLIAFIYDGKKLLKNCSMAFPSSISEYGDICFLRWRDEPLLSCIVGDGYSPDIGFVTRGE